MQKMIQKARGKNWAKLVAKRADEICKQRKDDVDLMIQILNGDIIHEAANQIALEIKCGIYDKMLMPKEYNL